MRLLIDANILLDVLQNREPERIKEIFNVMSLIFKFVDFSVSDLSCAAKQNWKDFEDTVQSVTAKRVNADFIITRNVRDFAASKVAVFTPSEWLEQVQGLNWTAELL